MLHQMADLMFVVLMCVMPVAYLPVLGYVALTFGLIRAGLASLLVAIAPAVWMIAFGPENLPPGAGIVLMICAVPAALSVVAILIGLVVAALRALKRIGSKSIYAGKAS